MKFWGDDRGQSVQVGAVLLFGFLVIALTTYQTTVVPQQNAEIEYNHNQAAGMDMLDLRNDLLTAGRTGRTTATTVQLGTRYPARALFINPPPPSGTIETVGTNDDAVNVTIGNATADGDVGDYWNGSDRAFNTGAIVYSPDYNQYQNAPDTGIDIGTGVVFNAQQDAKIPTTDQQLIQGNRINLVLLAGNLSKGGSYATSLDIRPVSSSENTVEIDSDQNVTITLATRLSVEQWEDLTSEEPVLAVESVGSIDEEFNRIRLVLKPGSYRLSVSKIGVGTVGSAGGTEAAYLTAVSGDAVVNENTEQSVRFELRDELNNPTGGEAVTVSINDSSLGCIYVTNPDNCGSSVTVDADDHDGEIEVQFRATNDIDGSSEPVRVEATFGGGSAAAERAAVNLTVVNTDRSGTDGGGGGNGDSDDGNDNNVPGSQDGEEYVAYKDADGDGVYDDGETRYTPSQLQNFDDQSADLRIADAIESNNKIQINKANSFVVEDGASVNTNGQFKVGNNVGSVTIEGSVSSSGQMQFQQSGDLNVIGGSIDADGEISVQNDGSIIANGATIESSTKVTLRAKSGDIDLTDATISTPGEVSITAENNADNIIANGATIESQTKVTLSSNSGDIGLSNADVSTPGEISISADGDGDDIIADGATLDSSTKVTLTTKTGDIDLRDATVSAPGEKKAKINNDDDGRIRVGGLGITGGNAKLIAEVRETSQVEGEGSVDPGEVEIKT
ncbi:hypothetical protein SY89_01273 [Halolamina pelagica]|uniref:Uncharacterized protein n=1 Tax=Halolamina pelagica TaxID=699431 RepID=A0A0P7GP52_9EURY|nr:hypothetical protein [Halolamina pelagica]KPN30538.1 hypothetical protein SY89_01273 [Halolamina pelagica]